jgi:hypothetical protein
MKNLALIGNCRDVSVQLGREKINLVDSADEPFDRLTHTFFVIFS